MFQILIVMSRFWGCKDAISPDLILIPVHQSWSINSVFPPRQDNNTCNATDLTTPLQSYASNMIVNQLYESCNPSYLMLLTGASNSVRCQLKELRISMWLTIYYRKIKHRYIFNRFRRPRFISSDGFGCGS